MENITVEAENIESTLDGDITISDGVPGEKNTAKPEIIHTTLHQIDVAGNQSKLIALGSDLNDLNDYLKKLLQDLRKKTERRSYKFQRNTTEFYRALDEFGENESLDAELCSALAARLLVQEVKTEEQYGGSLGTQKQGGLVQKGSFLQFLYKGESGLAYLGVKLEHQTFVDEEDFKRRSGLPDATKVYKACHVTFDSSSDPCDVHVFDTNSKPAAYWWNDFLELEVVRDDQVNTSKAVKAVVKVLGQYKDKYPHDYTLLRNKAIGAFKKHGQMNYSQFVNDVVGSHSPYDPDLKSKIAEIVDKLNKLPEKYGFDTQFELAPDAVDFRKKKINLTDEIELAYKEDIPDINNKIWAEKTSDGRCLVVIQSDAASNFQLKARTP